MVTSRDGLARQLRATAGVLQPRSRPRPTGETVRARAFLEQADITEQYYVEQELSRNPWAKPGDDPEGSIYLSLPYDGHRYFTRQAADDVARGLPERHERGATAVIGHLVLRNDAKTNLRQGLQLADHHGAIPIEVPVTRGGASEFAPLTADRKACAIRYEFEPDTPAILPAQLEISLTDPDSLGLADPSLDLLALGRHPDSSGNRLQEVVGKIRQRVGFRDQLMLRIDIHLSLPVRASHPGLHPTVTRMAINWPTITSLRTLSLQVGDSLPGGSDVLTFTEAPVSYNPMQECIEWEGVKMFAVDDDGVPADEELKEAADSGEGKLRHYRSAPMLLAMEHPGELYKQDALGVTADVAIPGYLMSGMEARLYDATGYYRRAPLKLTTKVRIAAQLTLDDAFATRNFSPYQHLFFDEIIPDETQIADIRTALEDRGFSVTKLWSENDVPYHDHNQKAVSWLHLADRKVGSYDMTLLILTTGRQFETERETVLDSGVKTTTRLQTGELRIFVRGELPRDSSVLTHEMNALQRTLHERYDRMRQRRY